MKAQDDEEWKSAGLPNVHFLTLLTKHRGVIILPLMVVLLPLEIYSLFFVFVIKVHVAARIDTTSIFNERKLHIIQLSNAINAQRIYLGSQTLSNIIS